MNTDNDTAQHSNDKPSRRQRRKRKNFTDHTYGARLPPEDARIIDDYGKHNGLDRSEVVRLGMHQFALRQQMKYKAPDPFREAHEHLIKTYSFPKWFV